MSWLSNLAGKAEDILNKIDSEAASVLVKENKPSKFITQAFSSDSDHKRSSSYSFPSSSSVPSNLGDAGGLPYRSVSINFRESGSLSSSPKKKASPSKPKDQDQSLIDFLNDSKKNNEDSLHFPKGNDSVNAAHFDAGHSSHSSVSSGSSFLAVSGRETPGFTALEMDTNSGVSHSSDAYLNVEAHSEPPLSITSSYHSNYSEGSSKETGERQSESLLLRKEVSSLNQEMAQVLRRAKEAEKESQRNKDQVSTLTLQQRQSEALLRDMQEREQELQARLKVKDETVASVTQKLELVSQRVEEREKTNKELQDQNQRLLQGADMSNNLHSEMVRSLQEKLKEADEALRKEREKLFEANKQFSDRICQLEEDQRGLSKELSESQRKAEEETKRLSTLNHQISNLKGEAADAREELSDYKAKAGRILQSKDALIASLKEGGGAGESENVYAEELEQLRGERDLLREELERCGERIKHLTNEMVQTEALAQHEASDALQKVAQFKEDLNKERSDTTLAQEELRQCKQELRCLQEELTRQKVSLSSRMEERDAEIQRLQKQIAHKQSSSSSLSELESRIHGLTESLIHKQTTIESLSTDKHTLQIQLERLQQQYNESQVMLNKDPVIDISQDEVRNRVPTFLLESPFDGGVTRRVKKAYGTLDKFSVRLGVFLRRYPIARVFVLLYMGLLHAWVMIVLLTYKPEMHGTDFGQPHPAEFGGNAPRGPHGD